MLIGMMVHPGAGQPPLLQSSGFCFRFEKQGQGGSGGGRGVCGRADRRTIMGGGTVVTGSHDPRAKVRRAPANNVACWRYYR